MPAIDDEEFAVSSPPSPCVVTCVIFRHFWYYTRSTLFPFKRFAYPIRVFQLLKLYQVSSQMEV